MGKAKFKLSTWKLEQLLGLPYNASLQCIIPTHTIGWERAYEITVDHPDLPDDVEIFPQWNKITRQEFVDWGIPDKHEDDVDGLA